MKSEVNVGNEDLNNDEQSNFIKKWNRDKTTFPENMIDIFMYGEITLLGDYLGYYTITREYNDVNYILTMPLENKLKFLISFIEFLEKLKRNNFIYRDCKIANMGVEIKGDLCIFIILDYDDVTLFSKDEFDKFKSANGIYYHFGTAPPLYILLNDNDSYNSTLIELYGMYTLLIELFNTDLDTYSLYNEIADFIYEYMENMINLALQNVQRINQKLSVVNLNATRKVLNGQIQKNLNFFNRNIAKYFTRVYDGDIENKLTGLIVKILEPTTQIVFDEVNRKYNIFMFKQIINNLLQEVIRLKGSVPVVPIVPVVHVAPIVSSHRHRSIRRSTIYLTPGNVEDLSEIVIKQKYLKYKQKYLELKQKISN